MRGGRAAWLALLLQPAARRTAAGDDACPATPLPPGTVADVADLACANAIADAYRFACV